MTNLDRTIRNRLARDPLAPRPGPPREPQGRAAAGVALLAVGRDWLAGLALAAACLAACAGCSVTDRLFDARGGQLFQGMDVLCQPREETELVARLQAGWFLNDRPNRTVVFSLAGREIGRAVTDFDGYARLPCAAPKQPGDYQVVATPADPRLASKVPAAAFLLAVRPADAPLLVTDLDRTVVADGFQSVLAGHAQPLADAARVLRRVEAEKGYSVVYLTHRPDFLCNKSRHWLAANDFPPGPLLLSNRRSFFAGSKSFKERRLADLKRRFPRLLVGIGDKPGDDQAYRACGIVTSIMLMPPAEKPRDRRSQAAELRALDDAVQVVVDWRQIEQVIFDGARFSRQRMLQVLAAPPATQPQGTAQPWRFMGLADDQERKINESAPESALGQLPGVTSVQLGQYADYLAAEKAGTIVRAETHGRWIYWAVEDSRCAGFPGGVSAMYMFVQRYRAEIPSAAPPATQPAYGNRSVSTQAR